MIVEHGNEKYLVDFQHSKPKVDRTEVVKDSTGREHVIQLDSARQRHRNKYRKTKCVIKFVVSETPLKTMDIAEGHSICCPNDQFKKEIGRKLSLRRASTSLHQTLKAAIWETYHNRSRSLEMIQA